MIVTMLYEGAIRRMLRDSQVVKYRQLEMNDEKVEELAESLVHCDQFMRIDLRENDRIGAAAVRSLSQKAPLRLLQAINFDGCRAIGDEGVQTFAAAAGGMRFLQRLSLCETSITEVGFLSVVGAINSGKLTRLDCLLANGNAIGDDGARAVADAASRGKLPALQTLGFGSMVRDDGISALISAASGLPLLRELRLHDNPSLRGAAAEVLQGAVRQGVFPALKSISLTDWSSLVPKLVAHLSAGLTAETVQTSQGRVTREDDMRVPPAPRDMSRGREALLVLQRFIFRAAPSEQLWSTLLEPVVEVLIRIVMATPDDMTLAQAVTCINELLRTQPRRLCTTSTLPHLLPPLLSALNRSDGEPSLHASVLDGVESVYQTSGMASVLPYLSNLSLQDRVHVEARLKSCGVERGVPSATPFNYGNLTRCSMLRHRAAAKTTASAMATTSMVRLRERVPVRR